MDEKIKEVINRLREYAANNGYSHSDYADTMTEAANILAELQKDATPVAWQIFDASGVMTLCVTTEPGAEQNYIERGYKARPLYTQPKAATVPESLTERISDLIASRLTGAYFCTRVWSAWSYGTMGQDDFESMEESDWPQEVASEIAAMLSAAPSLPAQSEGEQK